MDDISRFRRFLTIGSESHYQIGESSLNDRGVPECLQRLIDSERGIELIREVTQFSQAHPHMKHAPSLYSLAVCARSSFPEVKQAAYKAVETVCKTPPQLFTFLNYAKSLIDSKKGWGRALRRSVSRWYNSKDPLELAVLTTRFKSSSGWTHIDVLRLSHTKPENPGVGVVMKYLLKGLSAAKENTSEDLSPLLEYLQAVDTVKHSTDAAQVAAFIRQHGIFKEHIPTKLLNSSEVWSALIAKMTLWDLLPNIAKISSLDILNASNPTLSLVVKKLQDGSAVYSNRVLPMMVLIALRIYEQGKGKWSKNEQVVAALNNSYALTTSKIPREERSKRILVAVKVSSDPAKSTVRGSVLLSPLVAAAALLHYLLQTGPEATVVSYLSEVRPLSLSRATPLADVCKEIARVAIPLPPQLCQCDLSSPIRWAEEKNEKYDAMVLLSDSCESTGDVFAALHEYRNNLKLNTRLVVCGLTSPLIAENCPVELGSLQITGFDASVPNVISSFVSGQI